MHLYLNQLQQRVDVARARVQGQQANTCCLVQGAPQNNFPPKLSVALFDYRRELVSEADRILFRFNSSFLQIFSAFQLQVQFAVGLLCYHAVL
jgi:hypothetical protein